MRLMRRVGEWLLAEPQSALDDGRTLPWRFASRAVKPYAFAVSFSTFVVSWAILSGVAIGQLLNEFPGQLIGVAGFAAVMLLWVGWWYQRDDWMAI
jgi:hypothetical protein